MKFFKSYTKSLITATAFFVAGTTVPIHALPEYTATIAGIYSHFDEAIVQHFEPTFEDSFSPNSTEPLHTTIDKMKKSELVIQQFVKALKEKAAELKNNHQTSSELYTFINILLNVADELEKHFNKIYTTLTSGLKKYKDKKLAPAGFANVITTAINEIMIDANFKKLDHYLAQLQHIAETTIAAKICVIRKNLAKIWHEYKTRPKDNITALNLLKKRLPKI